MTLFQEEPSGSKLILRAKRMLPQRRLVAIQMKVRDCLHDSAV